MRSFYLLFFVISVLNTANAQFAPPPLPLYPSAGSYVPDSVDEIRSKLDALSKQNLPDSEQLLLRELDQTEVEITSVAGRRNYALQFKDVKSTTDQLIARLQRQVSSIQRYDCAANTAKYPDASSAYSSIWFEFSSFARSYSVQFDGEIFNLPVIMPNMTTVDVCNSTKDKLNSIEFVQEFQKITSQMQLKT